MTMTDQTETRELRERLTAALADRATVDRALADAQLRTRELETALQQVTYHRNRLLTEKDVAWGIVLSPETAPLPTEPDYQRLADAVVEIARWRMTPNANGLRVRTMSQREAEAAEPDVGTHVISIRSPGGPSAALRAGWGHVTFVGLTDIPDGVTERRIETEAVAAVARAVQRARVARANLLVHCVVGVSRSVGVAQAIAAATEYEYVDGVPVWVGGCKAVREAVALALGASAEPLARMEVEVTALRARVAELEAENDALHLAGAALIKENVAADARVLRLRAALDEITEESSYPIDYRDAFIEATSRARRALKETT